ncbi:MAG: PSD1 and planctomycete cytochrome C domain-containing protein [Pirellulales bacterium]
MNRFLRPNWLGTCSCLTLLLVAGGAVAEEADELRFFESQIRPLLAQQCLHCHGPKKQRGELRLDSRAALLKGGESGPAIVPGRPEESLLIEAVNHASLAMPPETRLADAEIAALTEWVRRGAPWPEAERTILAGPRSRRTITDEDRGYWAFRPVVRPLPPLSQPTSEARGGPDAFILERLQAAGLPPAPEADRRTLLRRLYFDLLGLPPSAAEVEDFCADSSPDAYERQVDRLLADPRHGERWARHWLDLVRYAESDGFKQDDYRPTAWRYRDYVVAAFNADKPYDRFVQEQLAGDELAPGDPEALVATGYLRHWMYEYNQRDVRSQWHNILNDVTDVTADVFLAMGLSCARCHDHKYDPLLQRDYYRFQAFFAALHPRDDLPVAAPAELAAYQERSADWELKTAELRRELTALEAEVRGRIAAAAIDKFPKDVRPMLRKAPADRDPFEHQLADLANRQVLLEQKNVKMETKLKDDLKRRWQDLQQRLAEYDVDRPASLPVAQAATDVGPAAPPTWIQGTRHTEPIPPGYLSVLDPSDASIPPPPTGTTTGRRLALARWITRPDHPLTGRVIVNRLWQQHFGRGLVRTASDFGRLGEPPTHPALLDWLAATLVEHDWHLKPVQRQLVTSATYRRASLVPETAAGRQIDPENRWWWRMNVTRLSAEQVRDSLLAVTGELNLAAGGPAVEWNQPRRTVYTRVLRNTREPLLDAFDAPDHIVSTAERNVTTTPNQALLMINGPYSLARAGALAARLHTLSLSEDRAGVEQLYAWVLARRPSSDEVQEALDFLGQSRAAGPSANGTAWQDLCHVLLNSNEFLYVD